MQKIALRLVLCSALLVVGTAAMAHDSIPVAPNNTGVNVRDRAPGAMTADQQSSAASDVDLTRKIRRAVVNDHSLSMLAHNVKIISANGQVTLRGPVNTEAERIAIASKAQSIAGAGNVDNQLQIK